MRIFTDEALKLREKLRHDFLINEDRFKGEITFTKNLRIKYHGIIVREGFKCAQIYFIIWHGELYIKGQTKGDWVAVYLMDSHESLQYFAEKIARGEVSYDEFLDFINDFLRTYFDIFKAFAVVPSDCGQINRILIYFDWSKVLEIPI